MENQTNQSLDSYDYNGSDYLATEFTIQEKMAMIFTPQWIVLYILCFFGLATNILSIVAIAFMPFKLNPHFKLIINLAMSDTLIIVSFVLHDFIFIFAQSNFCLIVLKEFLLHTSMLLTLMNLIGMAIDLYISILHPLKYNSLMSNSRCTYMIITLWLISIGLGLTDLLAAAIVQRPAERTLCFYVKHDNYDMSSMITCLIFFVLICIMAVYVRITMIVRRMNSRDPSLRNKQNAKACITTFIVTITFALCWLPYGIFTSIIYLVIHTGNIWFIKQNENHLFYINDILVLVLLLNTLFDPLIYAVRLRSVQLGYREIFNKLFCRGRHTDLRHVHARTSFISNYKRNTISFDPDIDHRIHTDQDIAKTSTDSSIKYSPIACYPNTPSDSHPEEEIYPRSPSTENNKAFDKVSNSDNVSLDDLFHSFFTADVDRKLFEHDLHRQSNVTETIT